MNLLLTMRGAVKRTRRGGLMSKKIISRVLATAAALVALAGGQSAVAAEEEGIAVAIVYDTSGSMKESVRTANGSYSPKYRIANRSLESIVKRIESFATNSPTGGTPRKIYSGLFVF